MRKLAAILIMSCLTLPALAAAESAAAQGVSDSVVNGSRGKPPWVGKPGKPPWPGKPGKPRHNAPLPLIGGLPAIIVIGGALFYVVHRTRRERDD